MIKYIEGDIFSSPAQVIVNTVNTVGVMGKGLALEFKQRYPNMFETYKRICEKHQFSIGRLMLVYEPDHWILLFPTKQNWRYPSKLEYIESGLIKFTRTYVEKNISSIAFPRLGCGNGELEWDQVKALMEKYLKPLPIDVYIYVKPFEVLPEHKAIISTLEWLRKNAKDMSYDGVKDDITYNSAMLPISLSIDDEKWSAVFKDDLVFNNSKDEHVVLTNDECYNIWDSARRSNLFIAQNQKEELFFCLLLNLGYVTKIKILEGSGSQFAYQLNNGIGRAFTIRGKL
ncbi:MAG: macro domain-containing protein [Clostridiales bacterium]|nr:macro domain-containing protein [Clostridiales bacterium]